MLHLAIHIFGFLPYRSNLFIIIIIIIIPTYEAMTTFTVDKLLAAMQANDTFPRQSPLSIAENM